MALCGRISLNEFRLADGNEAVPEVWFAECGEQGPTLARIATVDTRRRTISRHTRRRFTVGPVFADVGR